MARLKRRADGRYTATFMHNGRKQFFYGRTQAEAVPGEIGARLCR